MKIYYMDIHTARIPVFRTGTKTKIDEVFQEIDERLNDILTWIDSKTYDMPYDDIYGLKAKCNRKTVKTFRGWMEKLKKDNNLTIKEGDVWIALFTEEIPDPPERDLSVYEMEFFVGKRLIHQTGLCTHVNRVIHQTLIDRNVILNKLSLVVADLYFDGRKSEDDPVNSDAVEVFDYWMSQFALRAFEPQEFRDGDILIRLHKLDVLRGADFPEITTQGVRHEVLQPC